VVFNTSMTGYQEMLTDPSYAGQLLVLTYPMIGNYGIDDAVEESGCIQPTGLVIREAAAYASHLRSSGTLVEFLRRRGVVAIEEVDTRAVTRRIRVEGVMQGTITTDESAEEAFARMRSLPEYDSYNWVETVTTARAYDWAAPAEARFRVALVDGGVKRNIMRSLAARGAQVKVFPATVRAEVLLAERPDGIVLSPGPGDPRRLDAMVEEARKLIGKAPILGICLGHQVAAIALGAGIFKLPFGHRGGNHPVKELTTGRVTITAQNHGYAVDPNGLTSGAEVSHINLNDQTVEGLRLNTEPLITIQYHSEASPGPLDNTGIFDRFVEMMAATQGSAK
jgi:carbamoyl-phosphate synthase small subunit